ncbi:hypothetical protein [Streptosporangium sp. NPDC051022]|uniref:hypothetical protein n=1 Tax=Streptosporangium sp. NPDC051022 TaxID=3155752 RepID=UPI0034143CAF
MTAGIWPWEIEQGSDFEAELTLFTKPPNPQPMMLTGYRARAQIRPSYGTGTAVLYELTTENGRFTIDGPAGKIKISIPAEDSSAWMWLEGVYDLELISPTGRPTRLLKGPVTVDPEVTR